MRRILIAVVVTIAVVLAVNTVVTDRQTKERSSDLGHTVHLQGGALQVRSDGSHGKPSIVLLHGFAASMHWWTPVAERLAPRYHVERVDLLGHGGSSKPRHGYSMENQARLVIGALAQERVRRAVVVGHSMGGLVATAIAEQRPDLVRGVVIVDSPPTDQDGKLSFPATLGFVPVLGEALRHLVTDGVIRKQLEKEFAPGFHVPDQFVRDFHRMTYTSYDASHARSDDFREQRSLPDRLAATGKPLLVIFGDKDELVNPSSAGDYEAVPGARVTRIPGAGHSPMVESPDKVAELVSRFARRVGAGK